MNKRRTLLILFAVLIANILTINAQDNVGQFCVRAFQDNNGNALREPNDPFITANIAADLHDNSGLVIDSATLETSPTSAQGVICFQGLAAGQYTITVTSADYIGSGPNNLTAFVPSDGVPVLFEYGARPIVRADAANTDDEIDTEAVLKRLLVAGIGAAGTMFIVMLIGIFLYLAVVRQSSQSNEENLSHQLYMRPTSEQIPPPPSDYD